MFELGKLKLKCQEHPPTQQLQDRVERLMVELEVVQSDLALLASAEGDEPSGSSPDCRSAHACLLVDSWGIKTDTLLERLISEPPGAKSVVQACELFM